MEQKRAFGPGEQLLRAVQAQQAGAVQRGAQGVGTELERAIADIQQVGADRGMRGQLDQQRLFGAGARPAVQLAEAGAQGTTTQLGGLLRQLEGTRRQAGTDFQDRARNRRQTAQLERRGLREQEQQTKAELRAGTEAQRIQAARAAAAAAERDAQRQREKQVEQLESTARDVMERRVGADGYVSPKTFQRVRLMWQQLGGDPEDFFDRFKTDFVNPLHSRDYTQEGFIDLRRRGSTSSRGRMLADQFKQAQGF